MQLFYKFIAIIPFSKSNKKEILFIKCPSKGKFTNACIYEILKVPSPDKELISVLTNNELISTPLYKFVLIYYFSI